VASDGVVLACPPGGKWGRKRVGIDRLHFASWNVGTLTSKSIELVQALYRRNVNIACIQETKWVGAKAREIDGYKLWYSGGTRAKNAVGILVEKELTDRVVEVRRNSDRIMSIKLVLGAIVLNVISVYAPQMGLTDDIKKVFWKELEQVLQSIPRHEKLFLGGDFNGYIGEKAYGYVRTHGGFGFGVRNSGGVTLLDFATAFDLTIGNSLFKKREEHLVTFRSGSCRTQIDYCLIRANHRSLCRDCKVIPSEFLGTQHRLLVIDMVIKGFRVKRRSGGVVRVRW